MEISKDTQEPQAINGRTLPADELKRLTDFFSLLIKIDKRVTKAKNYGKEDK